MTGGRKTVSVPAVMSAGTVLAYLHILKPYDMIKQTDKLEFGRIADFVFVELIKSALLYTFR